MPDEQQKAQKHTFISVATCEVCECKIIFHENVGVTAPAGKARDAAINEFRRTISFMLQDEYPICEECELELAAMFAAGLFDEEEDEG